VRFLSSLVRAIRRPVPETRLIPDQPPNRRAELVVALLLLLAFLAFAGFIAAYVASGDTQYLGLALGIGLSALGGALALASRTVVAQETVAEPREVVLIHEQEELESTVLVQQGVDRISRRRLLTVSGGAAAFAMVSALVVPLGSCGPFTSARKILLETPWRRGRRLVDEKGEPIAAANVTQGAFLTAFPEGANRERLDASLILVRLPRDELELPEHLRGFDADGVLAFSKICPHAGCAISMYRYPLYKPVEPRPALVCPCHYSTFDVAKGGELIFGPAGRPLPMLPLSIDREGNLRARGPFPEGVGPSWWGVREKGRA
jgi:ubiquinol-cytochrome c reductase iron-sulfur subunit